MTEKIGIGIIPPDEYSNFVRKKEIELSKKFGTIMGLLQPPHISLKSSFDTEELQPFLEYCEDLSKQITPFEITVDGYDFFEPYVILINVIKSSDLQNLHEKILNDLNLRFDIQAKPTEGDNVRFHTTLAYGDLTKENFYLAREEIKDQEFKYNFTVREIALFRFTGEEWVILKKFKIKNGKN